MTVQAMPITEEFAHGHLYGDLAGVIFSTSGESEKSLRESLSVSNRYLAPLFGAVLSKFEKPSIPNIVLEWRDCTGWTETDRTELNESDTVQLIKALSSITEADVTAQAEVICAPSDIVRCATAITNFLAGLLDQKLPAFIEND